MYTSYYTGCFLQLGGLGSGFRCFAWRQFWLITTPAHSVFLANMVDSGGAGRIFSCPHFYPHFGVPGTKFTGERAECPREATMNSKNLKSARIDEQGYDFRCLDRWSVIPACGITLGGFYVNKMHYKNIVEL